MQMPELLHLILSGTRPRPLYGAAELGFIL